jgi:hypothetical protein
MEEAYSGTNVVLGEVVCIEESLCFWQLRWIWAVLTGLEMAWNLQGSNIDPLK